MRVTEPSGTACKCRTDEPSRVRRGQGTRGFSYFLLMRRLIASKERSAAKMGWAESRVRAYQRGERAGWLERRMLEHANPVHFPMAVAASIGLIYGAWVHSLPWIVASAALALAGHLYCWTRSDPVESRGSGSAA